MKKVAAVLSIIGLLALVGCGKSEVKTAEVKPVEVKNGEVVQVAPGVSMSSTVEVKDAEPVTPSLTKEQAKQAAQKLYKDIKAAQADGVKVMEFLSQYPEQGGEIRDVSVKFNKAIDSNPLRTSNASFNACLIFADYARLAWQDTYGLYQSEKNGTVNMSKLKMAEDTKKRLAQHEKDCKAELK